MKVTVMRPVEVEISKVRVELPVRYGEEDIPNDFPLREGENWTATIDIETGRIADYPPEHPFKMHMKVVDGGSYYLLDADGKTVASLEGEYVPRLIPGEYGDYVILDIDENGRITNWPRNPDVEAFINDADD